MEANATCMVIAVVHPDIGQVGVVVTRDEGTGAEQPVEVFDGFLDLPEEEIEIADLVGDDFSHRVPVAGPRARLRVTVDDPEMAQKVTIFVSPA
ncbi:hypothetical protein [Streptomyces sp. NPDC058664]|uniref:hypothetical protein n=1 Tax=unclassified Streptomyces TaxID=2593676 RepID=UPI0036529558